MEFFIFLFIMIIIYSIASDYFRKRKEVKQNNTFQSANEEIDSFIRLKDEKLVSTKIINEPKTNTLVNSEVIKKDEPIDFSKIINNYYVQNNIYVEVKEQSGKKTKDEKHTEKVWKDLGFSIKKGETYSSIFYGKELFTSEQVEKISYKKEPLQLEHGLTTNQKKVKQLGYTLVNKYASKRKAKDILVDKYGFDEKTAKYAAGYRGYENW